MVASALVSSKKRSTVLVDRMDDDYYEYSHSFICFIIRTYTRVHPKLLAAGRAHGCIVR